MKKEGKGNTGTGGSPAERNEIMRTFILSAALAVGALVGLTPAKADASWLSQAYHARYPAYYGSYYYPGYGYYAPGFNYYNYSYGPSYGYWPYYRSSHVSPWRYHGGYGSVHRHRGWPHPGGWHHGGHHHH